MLESEDSSIERIDDSSYKYKLELSSEMMLRFRIYGYPLPDIRVTRNDVEYEHYRISENRRTVVIRKTVERTDAGNYVILAGNRVTGTAELKILVTVIDTSRTGKPEKPSPPEPPFSISPLPDTSALHLHWNPPLSDGGSELIKYSIEQKLRTTNWQKLADVQSETTSFTVQNVQQNVQYTFRVTAENQVGKSEPLVSEPVNIDTLRKLRLPPPEPPFDISGMTSTSFTLRWTEPKKPNDIVGYLVEKREMDKKAWQKCSVTETNTMEVAGLKTGVSYHFRICSVSESNECSEFVMIQEEAITIGKRISKFFKKYKK